MVVHVSHTWSQLLLKMISACGKHTTVEEQREARRTGYYCLSKVCWRSEQSWATNLFSLLLFPCLSPPPPRSNVIQSQCVPTDGLAVPSWLPSNGLSCCLWTGHRLDQFTSCPSSESLRRWSKKGRGISHQALYRIWYIYEPLGPSKCHLSNKSIWEFNLTSQNMKHKYCSLF